MKAWFQRFMSGRYGSDQFSMFLSILALILLVLGMFVSGILYYVGLIVLIYSYFRMFSRNIQKRYAENQWYLARSSAVREWFSRLRNRFAQRQYLPLFQVPALQDRPSASPKAGAASRSPAPNAAPSSSARAEQILQHRAERLTLYVRICYHLPERPDRISPGLLPGLLLRSLRGTGKALRHAPGG